MIRNGHADILPQIGKFCLAYGVQLTGILKLLLFECQFFDVSGKGSQCSNQSL